MEATEPEDRATPSISTPWRARCSWSRSGELDLAAAPRLATVLSMATAGAEPCVVLDLTEVDFIDSTALGAIMHASTEAEATGKSMLVVALDGPVRRLLEITNLTGRFRVYPSRDDALAAARGLTDPLDRRRVGAEQERDPVRRVGVRDVLDRDLALEGDLGLRLARELEREAVRAALDGA